MSDMIKKICELVSIESVTGAEPLQWKPYGEKVDEALKYILSLCESFGFRTKNCDGRIGYAEIGQGDDIIAVLCHLDVVPSGGGWTFEPFEGTVKDGKLYGRGVIDDKGPAITAIYAMRDILCSKKKLEKRIRIIFGLQEESGDWQDIAYYKANEELPTMGFTPDSKFPAIYCEKGIAVFRLEMPLNISGFLDAKGGEAANMVPDYAQCTVRGADGRTEYLDADGISAHGSRPEEGKNAISALMNQILNANIDCKFAHWYVKHLGSDCNGNGIDCAFEDESGKLTLNPGKLYTEGDKLVLMLDVRYPVTYTALQVLERLQCIAIPYGIDVSLYSEEKPVHIARNSKIMRSLLSAYESCTGEVALPEIIGGGTYARAMDNIAAFGPVFPGRERMEHKADEFVFIEDLKKAREIYRTALERLASE